MTRITVQYAGDKVAGLQIDGHAGYARSGRDIVCAAVSCLSTTCVNALEAVAGVRPIVQADEAAGAMAIRLPQALAPQAEHDAQVILRSTLQGYRDIAQAYPNNLILLDGGKYHDEA